jgi:membrane-associated phospholipid phosphatase
MGFKQRNIVDMSVLGGTYASIVYLLLAWSLQWNPVTFILYSVLGYAILSGIRLIYHKPRPKPQKYTNLLEKIDAGSFPSLHTLRASLIVFHAQQYVSTNTLLVLSFTVVLVMYSRMMQKKHDVYDVTAGVILAYFITFWF